MTASETIPADRIPVSLFREILIWPLALHLPGDATQPGALAEALAATIDRVAESSTGPQEWEPVDDPIKHIAPPEPTNREESLLRTWEAESYAEGVYFHEFVQSFLFSRRRTRQELRVNGAERTDPEPFRLFRRSDVTGLDVKLPHQRELRLIVKRLNLYIFRTGSAILVVELWNRNGASIGDWTLAEVLDFHDLFRRAYLPYPVITDKAFGLPDLVPNHVTWRLRDRPSMCFDILQDVTRGIHGDDNPDGMIAGYLAAPELDHRTRGRRFPPVFHHWRWLLPKAMPLAPYHPPGPFGERWHQVVDERMPTIATISVCGTEQNDRYYFDRTRRGDLVRLCFADKFSSDPYPYDAQFLSDFETKHVYGRFRDSGTLFLASGYAFVAYGAATGFFENVLATHMRRHYFQMALLAHFELASLLAFSSRISRAVEHHDDRDPEVFENRMQAIEDEFLQFIHRFRFTGVSNHVQANELFDLWRRHLRLKEIFEDLYTEITSATRYLGNRAGSRSARMAERLSTIATFGVIFGLVFGFLGMNVLFDSKSVEPLGGKYLLSSSIVAGTAAICSGLALGLFRWLRRDGKGTAHLETDAPSAERRIERLLKHVTIYLLALFAALVLGFLGFERTASPIPAPPRSEIVD